MKNKTNSQILIKYKYKIIGININCEDKVLLSCLSHEVVLNHLKVRFSPQQLKTPPQSVALVGHSMGGVVARALFTLPRFNPHLVSLIITQASPHMAPVLALDPYLLGEPSWSPCCRSP